MAVGQHRPAAAPLAAEFLPPPHPPLAGGVWLCDPKEAMEVRLAHEVELCLEQYLEQPVELAVRVSPRGVN